MKTKTIPIKDLTMPRYPALPWPVPESHEKWENSKENGHYQLLFKCIHCSLEFLILSFRTENEIIDAFRVNIRIGSLAIKVYCPECGHQKSSLIGYRQHKGEIFKFASEFIQE